MYFLSTALLALAVSTGVSISCGNLCGILLTCIYAGVIAVPLGISYDKTTGLSAAETANKGRLDAATTLGMSCSSFSRPAMLRHFNQRTRKWPR